MVANTPINSADFETLIQECTQQEGDATRWMCRYCDHTERRKRFNFIAHMKTHFPKEIVQYVCPSCLATFTLKGGLTRHKARRSCGNSSIATDDTDSDSSRQMSTSPTSRTRGLSPPTVYSSPSTTPSDRVISLPPDERSLPSIQSLRLFDGVPNESAKLKTLRPSVAALAPACLGNCISSWFNTPSPGHSRASSAEFQPIFIEDHDASGSGVELSIHFSAMKQDGMGQRL